jgi:hypothetical protein
MVLGFCAPEKSSISVHLQRPGKHPGSSAKQGASNLKFTEEPVLDPDEIDKRLKTALFRHSLVAALADLEPGERNRQLRVLANRVHTLPCGRRARLGLSTLKRWWRASRTPGLATLMPKLRRDYGASRAIPEEWIKKAINLRREIPSRTARVLVEILSRLEGCPTLNKHTLDTVLRRRGWTRAQAGKKPLKRKVRWMAKHVNDLWQGDATPGLWLPTQNPVGKQQTQLFLWLDDVSRVVPYAEFFWDAKLPRMERTLKLALCRRGLPNKTYVDYVKLHIIGVMLRSVICEAAPTKAA